MPNHDTRKYRSEVWDNMHYAFARFNDHQVRGVIRFSSRLDDGRLKQALDLSAEYAFPLLRCRLVDNLIRLSWEDAGFSSNDMLVIKETENIEEAVQAQLCSCIYEYTGPQIRVSVIRSAENDVLCINMNHMLSDGAGFKEFLYSLGDTYSRLKVDGDFKPAFAMGCRSTHQVVRAFGMRQRFAGRMKRYTNSNYEKNISFTLEGNRSNPFVVTHAIDRSLFLKVKSYARKHGSTINDVFLTAYVRALQSFTDGYVPVVQCVNDLRKYLPGKNSASFCNLTSDMFCAVGQDVGGSFDDTLGKVKEVMDAEKNKSGWLSQIMLLEALFFLLPHRIARNLVLKHYSSPPIAMSNIGIIDHSRLSFGGAEITDAYVTGSIKYNPSLLLSLSTYDDAVTLSVCFHGTQGDREKIRALLERIEGELPRQ